MGDILVKDRVDALGLFGAGRQWNMAGGLALGKEALVDAGQLLLRIDMVWSRFLALIQVLIAVSVRELI